MKKKDAELIRLTLDGDDTAFEELVNKYRRAVHALVWSKIEDYHIAEELTQDVFLKAYQKLESLKKPQSFAGWLYVSASRRCIAWQRKKRLPTIPFDETKSTQHPETTYSQYVVEENQRISEETQREVVKKLLAKLPESERTIITLHFFSEMSSSEIGAFLGVSANTIRSRLRRALQRLQKEETMIREALEHFQISPNLTDNIMREISHIKPTSSGSKPIIPWIVAASSAVIIALMLGIGSQFLAHFQKPYNLDAQVETKIELVDSSLVLNLEEAGDTRNQIGRVNAVGDNNSNEQKQEDVVLVAAQNSEVDVSSNRQQWIPATPIRGSYVSNILATPDGEIYALGYERHFYKLNTDGSEWKLLYDLGALETSGWGAHSAMAKWKNTLYVLLYNELFSSTDDGKTWNLLHTWDEHLLPKSIVGTAQALYVGFSFGWSTKVFKSEDNGKTWKTVSDGLNGKIVKIINMKNTLFAATNNGLFRLNGDRWEGVELPDPTVGGILSVAAAGEKLFVAAAFSHDAIRDPERVYDGQEQGWWIFRSADHGDTWKEITPTNGWSQKTRQIGITLLAAGETLIAMAHGTIRSIDGQATGVRFIENVQIGIGMVRSINGGDTWLPIDSSLNLPYFYPAVTPKERTFYIVSSDGLQRSTDDGKSWDKVYIPQEMDRGPIRYPIGDIIAFRNGDKQHSTLASIYARYGSSHFRIGEIARTADNGKSWQTIEMEIPPVSENQRIRQPIISQIVKSNGEIYAKGEDNVGTARTTLYRVSQEDRKLVPIEDIPIFDGTLLRNYHKYGKRSKDDLLAYHNLVKENSFGASQFFKKLDELQPDKPTDQQQINRLFDVAFWGPFAVSNDTIYMEYNFKLFRWTIGEKEWHDTGLEETCELDLGFPTKVLKLAVAGDTVYAGKRDGHLFVSFDRGDNWTDLTSALPFTVRTFKDILVDDFTAYVATDAGIMRTSDGRNWNTITDTAGTNLIMEHLAVDDGVLYGVTKDTGIYRIENGNWQQVVPEIPENVTSLAVSGNTIYVGTEYNEMLHFTLEE